MIACYPVRQVLKTRLFPVSLRNGLISSNHYSTVQTPDYIQAALSDDISTVPLSFDKFSNYESSSKNSPIVFLHGLFGSKSNNRTVAKQLSSLLTRDVYCLDLRNHGDSPHTKYHDYPSISADVEKFLKDEGLLDPQPIIIGHSMGAKTAMAIALRKPNWLKMLIAVDNAPVSYPYSAGSKFSRYVRCLQEITTLAGPHAVISRTAADDRLSKIEPSLPVRQFLLTNISRKTKSEITDEFELNKKKYQDDIHHVPAFKSKIPLGTLGSAIDNGNIAVWPYDSNYSRFGGATLFVRGTESTYVADDVLAEIGKFFPRFEVKDVKAGHWLISENPKEFVEVVKDWIEFKEEAIKDELEGNNLII
ncbi:Imo32 protein [Saccharomycopsis crataegensis]|uniref:Imo32 protein n=1 Tax=Saccharomycopsis crataegensis TaxID=43959 RepID=A0AAV5QP38_9ASCO|nr:Imo32 protein [Saccharomycopsis crataegensis]